MINVLLLVFTILYYTRIFKNNVLAFDLLLGIKTLLPINFPHQSPYLHALERDYSDY